MNVIMRANHVYSRHSKAGANAVIDQLMLQSKDVRYLDRFSLGKYITSGNGFCLSQATKPVPETKNKSQRALEIIRLLKYSETRNLRVHKR